MRWRIAVERVLGRLGWDLTAAGWRNVYDKAGEVI